MGKKERCQLLSCVVTFIYILNHTASLAQSSSFESPQTPVTPSRPTDRDSVTKSSESLVPIRKRRPPSPSNTDDGFKPSKKRKPVTVNASQPDGDLGCESTHTLNREDSPSDAPPHPPVEEIEMWVPTSTAKFGPPKRKHTAARARARHPTKERRLKPIVSSVKSVRTQAPLTVSRQPVGLSESQIVALREEEEESQSQPHRFASRWSPKLGSSSHDSTPSDPLQTFTGDARGEVGETSQEVRDNHPTNQLSTDSQPIDRNANTSHVSGLRNEACHSQDSATKLPILGGSEVSPTPTSPGSTRKSLVNPEVPAVISPSTKPLLPEKQGPRSIANSTPSSVGKNFLTSQPASRTLAERRAMEARARLELVRRAAALITENIVEGRSSTSIAPQVTTQPPPHVVLQQVVNGLESSSQSQVAVENPKIRRIPSSDPRETGPSVESKEDTVTQDKSDQHVNLGAANLSPHENEVINSATLR